jgi:hypothetical protein
MQILGRQLRGKRCRICDVDGLRTLERRRDRRQRQDQRPASAGQPEPIDKSSGASLAQSRERIPNPDGAMVAAEKPSLCPNTRGRFLARGQTA